MKTTHLFTIALIFFFGTIKGQQPNQSRIKDLDPNIKSLKVGDKVPIIPASKIINHVTKNVKISDFKDQLLILDFWDTYCGSCIEALPKLDEMQKKFSNRIKIIPVTWQKEGEVIQFFKTNKYLKNQSPSFQLPCIVEDKTLAAYFRHKMISHEVWIYKGNVIAITKPEYVNENNIQFVLDGNKPNWPIKIDAEDFDLNSPLMTLINNPLPNNKNNFFSYSVVTGQRDGLNKGGFKLGIDSVTGMKRLALYNKSIISTFKILLFNSDSVRKNFILTPGRIVLEVKDSTKFIYNPKYGLLDKWNRENQICYELKSSKQIGDIKMIKNAISDLNSKLDLNARWEKRMVNCLILKRIKGRNVDTTLAQNGGQSIPVFLLFKLENTNKFPPAIDESGITDNISIGEYDGTLDGLRKQLNIIGLDLIEEKRKIDVIVISEVD